VIPSERRYAPMQAGVGYALRNARAELRGVLGTRPEAEPRAVIDALIATAGALGAGNPSAAARALSPALFDPGGAVTLRRLGELGPLPLGTDATQQVAREMARLDADQRWFGAADTEPRAGAGLTTLGVGEGGY
jgi:hypothetical protein